MVQAAQQKTKKAIYEEPLTGENGKPWEAFNLYLNLGPTRSIDKVRQSLGKVPGYVGQLEKWSKKFNWVQRALQFDVDQEVIDRQIVLAEQRRLFVQDIEQLRKQKKLVALQLINQGMKLIDVVNKRIETLTPTEIAFLTPLEMAALSKVAISNIQFASILMDESLGLTKIVETINATKK